MLSEKRSRARRFGRKAPAPLQLPRVRRDFAIAHTIAIDGLSQISCLVGINEVAWKAEINVRLLFYHPDNETIKYMSYEILLKPHIKSNSSVKSLVFQQVTTLALKKINEMGVQMFREAALVTTVINQSVELNEK
ncbi:hypothetical protein HNY73_005558 [Argiope bruennichi]|uniref:Uncharacterized protein n=1 Tax=Argiope bruennichi TaxID=94029 RepID=A0A8T0FJB6_ARGBR|nr:hypothetical protein HNY73_005558 [Argiope bruennichi]